MTSAGEGFDRSDPAVRATARMQAFERRDRSLRLAIGLGLGALAVVAPFLAEPLTAESGSIVGAVVAALLLLALATAVWPYEWSAEERRHRRLEAIWREVRSDADAVVAWERYAAWAESAGRQVNLALIRCAPRTGDTGFTASPYSRQLVSRIDGEDVEAAAEAMEALRAEASEREAQARERYHHEQAEAEQAAHELTLKEIDDAAAADIAAGEEQARRELAAQEEAEQKAQAEALARALRSP
jgi:hypothetical protein